MITHEALMVLVNELAFSKRVNREYSSKYGIEGAKIGTTLNVRKPPRYIGRSGAALSVEDMTDTSVPVVLDTQFGVDINFTSADLLLTIDDFSRRYIKPAVATIANKIDFDGLSMAAKATANFVGVPGTVPSALLTYLQAGVALDNTATPRDSDRSLVLTPQMQANIVDSLKGLYNSQPRIKEQYDKGEMTEAAGFRWMMDQNVYSHTIGVLGGAPLVNGAAQVGASLVTNGWTAAAVLRLKKGDIFTIAGVFQVNPQNRQNVGSLQDFVVKADASSDGAGNMTISIDPPITVSGAFQTVTASPANGAALTVFGAAGTVTPQGMAFHRDAFTLVTADLPMPRGVDMAARASDPDSGVSIRIVRQYDVVNDKFPCRLDVLYGWAALRPEMACRIAS